MLPLLPRLLWRENLLSSYKQKLSNSIDSIQILPENTQDAVNLLSDLIKAAVPPIKSSNTTTPFIRSFRKKPWFDYGCLRARKRSFKLLNLVRVTNSYFAISAYRSAAKNYKNLCETKKREYFSLINSQLKTVKDSKQMWQLINQFKPRNFVVGSNIIMSDWFNYFKGLLNPDTPPLTILYAEPYSISTCLDSPFQADDLGTVLSNFKPNKAPSCDRISYEFL